MADKIIKRIEDAIPLDSSGRVCWLSSLGEYAGAAFASIPRGALHSAFQNNGCLRLGIALPFLAAREGNTPLKCGLCTDTLTDELGAHALACGHMF